MKHLLFTLLVLLSLVACKESEIIVPTPEIIQVCLLDETKEIDYFGRETTIKYHYDENNKLIRISYFKKNELWYFDTFEYDEKGNIIIRKKHNSYGGWAIENEFKYNDAGLLVENKAYNLFTNITPYPVRSITTNSYSSNSLLRTAQREDVTGDVVEAIYEQSNNKLIKYLTFNSNLETKTLVEFDSRLHALSASPAFLKLMLEEVELLPIGITNTNILKQEHYFSNGNVSEYYTYSSVIDYNEAGYPINEERTRLSGQNQTFTHTYTCK